MESMFQLYVFTVRYSDNDNGFVRGINYYYSFSEKKRSKYFIYRNWKKFQKYFKTYSLLKQINKEDKIIAINSWTNLLGTHLFAWILCKFFKAKLIVEASEHPLRFHQGGKRKKISGKIKLYIESRLCDGILCISRYLLNFYGNHGVSKRKLLQVPSTIDPSGFIKTVERTFPEKYIGYFGSLTFKRDNVDLLINAFAIFNRYHPELFLVLGGISTQDGREQILSLIKTLQIESKVILLDFLSRMDILKYITNADILIMTRSRDLESDASYPSKLTEFLATGKPVISVNVGEVSDFLKDTENAFLIEPGNLKQLVEKLEFVYQDYENALEIGLKGKELTNGIFNYRYQSQRILSYINSLKT